MTKKSNHVFPSSSRWAVKKSGSERALKTFATRDAAIEYGRALSRTEKTELYVHKKNGMIEVRNSYINSLTSTKDN